MSNYRRVLSPGGCFFFTVVTYNRQPIFANTWAVDRLRDGFCRVRSKRPFTVDAMVVLPDHVHCIWRLPAEDDDYATRWRLIKHHVARGMEVQRTGRREKQVWQRRYWEHLIRDETDWRRHMDYIHYNPVKHGLVESPLDWEYSSFRKYVAQGKYPAHWGAGKPIVFADEVGRE